MSKQKSASFDVLGTCFHFTPAINLIHKILTRASSPKTSIDATTLFHVWFYAAQRDFTYTSLAGSYTPIIKIFELTLRRAFGIVGFPDAEKHVSDSDIEGVMSEMKKLPAREGLKECWEGLRGSGWDVYAVTNGGREGSKGYYKLAGIELDDEHLVSCDDENLRAAKPDPKVYEVSNQKLDKMGCAKNGDGQKGERWFVAAHTWDLIAARKAGFKTAWIAHEEVDPVTELFGKFDVYAKDLKECMEKMNAAAS